MIERKPLVINYRPGQGYWVLAILLSIFVSTLLAGKLWGGKTYNREMAEKMQLEVKAADLEIGLSDAKLQLSRIGKSVSFRVRVVRGSEAKLRGHSKKFPGFP